MSSNKSDRLTFLSTPRMVALGSMIILGGAILLIFGLSFMLSGAFSPVPTVEETAPVIHSQEKSLPASLNHPEPVNGAVFQALNDEFVAPLTIENNESVAFFFVLSPLNSDSSSGDDFTTNFLKLLSNVKFYVRANSTANINVPLGEYELYSASGSTWYGFDNFFGRDTIYQKYDGTYKFTESNGAYSGYTIVLDYLQNKVMDSDYISKEEFPN